MSKGLKYSRVSKGLKYCMVSFAHSHTRVMHMCAQASGVLAAVPMLLVQASDEDVVPLGALDVAFAVISRKDRFELPSA